MNRNFDRIDIIFILLISIYLIVLFIFILWFILDKLEKKEIAKKGSSILSSNSKKTKKTMKVKQEEVINQTTKSIIENNKLRKILTLQKILTQKIQQIRKTLAKIAILQKLQNQHLKKLLAKLKIKQKVHQIKKELFPKQILKLRKIIPQIEIMDM